MPPSPWAAREVAAGEIRPRKRWYWFAVGLGIVSVVAAFVIGFLALRDLVDTIDDFQRVDEPGEQLIEFEAGSYTVYREISDAGAGRIAGVTITGPDGRAIDTDPYMTSLTYDTGGRDGVALSTFRAPVDGDYVVAVGGDAAIVAIGPGIGSGLVAGVLAALGIGFGGVIAAAVIAIVVAVKRSRARRAMMWHG